MAYHKIVAVPTDAIGTMLAILIGMASLAFVSGVNTVTLVEGADMLAERYLKRRYQAGKEEGRTEAWQVWEEWNQRRIAAEKAGEKFDEPPPSLDNRS